ncbi:uncharacterized protein LOC144714739 isoform X9 [Wolffia australiana]
MEEHAPKQVALAAGLISHVEGLLNSGISSLETHNGNKGPNTPEDASWMLSTLFKLTSTLVMIPCTLPKGPSLTAQKLLSVVEYQTWLTPTVKVKMLCAVISLLATLSQKELPYISCNPEIIGNDKLFIGDDSYQMHLASTSVFFAHKLIQTLETSSSATGRLVLDACNCLEMFFQRGEELSSMCSRMMKMARHRL